MSLDQQAPRFISNSFGDKLLYEVNRGTFDKVGSTALFEQQYGSLFSVPDTLFIVIGTDSGLLPRWIAEQEPPPGSRFVFVELPELVDVIRDRLAGLLEQKSFSLANAANWLDLAEECRYSDYAYLDRLKVVASLGALDANLPEYRLLEADVAGKIGDYIRDIQIQLGSHAFIRRQIENIADNHTPATVLRDIAPGETAVVLGGGPSLDDILPWVIEHRDRITVIAVSRIARRLLDSDLRPDIVVSIDPHDVSFDVSKEALLFEHRPLLVCGNHVSSHLLGQWPGPSVYRGSRFPWPSDNDPDNLPMAGPTVTNLAIAMAVDMGYSRVILAGVDLCHSPEGHTHASGSNERAVGPRLGVVGQQVETNSGQLADTDPAFAQAVHITGEQAGRAQEQGCEIINPAVHAARIEHVRHIPLAGIDTPGLPRSGIRDRIDSRLGDQVGRMQQALQAARQELAWAHKQLQDVLKLTDEALDANQRLFSDSDNGHDFRYKKRMDKIEHKLDRQFRKITPTLKSFSLGGFLGLIRPRRETDWEDKEIQAWGRRYYEIYRDGANRLLELIDASQQRTAVRLEELKPSPDLGLLLEQWQRDGQPARAIHFRQRHPQLVDQAPAKIQKTFGEMAAQLDQLLAQTETRQARNLQYFHSLQPVRSKLQILFRQGNRDELTRLANNLERIDQPLAMELASLARGYLAELVDDSESAMHHYQLLLDAAAEKLGAEQKLQASPCLEDALRRMSYLALQQQDTQTALLSLDVLSAISPMYEPQYAELLRMSGRIQDAADVYTDYLKKIPDDLATMIKLGKLFQDAGAAESACWAYDYVLEKAPDNQAALRLRESLKIDGAVS